MQETSDVSRYYVYILLSLKDKKLYVGFTKNLKNRLITHASGKVISTKNRRPLKLIHYEYFINLADAKAREVFLKSGAGHEQIKAFLKRTLNIIYRSFNSRKINAIINARFVDCL